MYQNYFDWGFAINSIGGVYRTATDFVADVGGKPLWSNGRQTVLMIWTCPLICLPSTSLSGSNSIPNLRCNSHCFLETSDKWSSEMKRITEITRGFPPRLRANDRYADGYVISVSASATVHANIALPVNSSRGTKIVAALVVIDFGISRLVADMSSIRMDDLCSITRTWLNTTASTAGHKLSAWRRSQVMIRLV